MCLEDWRWIVPLPKSEMNCYMLPKVRLFLLWLRSTEDGEVWHFPIIIAITAIHLLLNQKGTWLTNTNLFFVTCCGKTRAGLDSSWKVGSGSFFSADSAVFSVSAAVSLSPAAGAPDSIFSLPSLEVGVATLSVSMATGAVVLSPSAVLLLFDSCRKSYPPCPSKSTHTHPRVPPCPSKPTHTHPRVPPWPNPHKPTDRDNWTNIPQLPFHRRQLPSSSPWPLLWRWLTAQQWQPTNTQTNMATRQRGGLLLALPFPWESLSLSWAWEGRHRGRAWHWNETPFLASAVCAYRQKDTLQWTHSNPAGHPWGPSQSVLIRGVASLQGWICTIQWTHFNLATCYPIDRHIIP